jgi:hypothetical protein
MEAVVCIAEVKETQTRSGNVRYVVKDEDGNEYTTFRPEIGRSAFEFEGRRARIEYHESQRGEYRNVYLDRIEEAPSADEDDGVPDRDERIAETGWSTAIEAAPWLLGTTPPESEAEPREFFEKLKPFKDLVADDIKQSAETDDETDDDGHAT